MFIRSMKGKPIFLIVISLLTFYSCGSFSQTTSEKQTPWAGDASNDDSTAPPPRPINIYCVGCSERNNSYTGIYEITWDTEDKTATYYQWRENSGSWKNTIYRGVVFPEGEYSNISERSQNAKRGNFYYDVRACNKHGCSSTIRSPIIKSSRFIRIDRFAATNGESRDEYQFVIMSDPVQFPEDFEYEVSVIDANGVAVSGSNYRQVNQYRFSVDAIGNYIITYEWSSGSRAHINITNPLRSSLNPTLSLSNASSVDLDGSFSVTASSSYLNDKSALGGSLQLIELTGPDGQILTTPKTIDLAVNPPFESSAKYSYSSMSSGEYLFKVRTCVEWYGGATDCTESSETWAQLVDRSHTEFAFPDIGINWTDYEIYVGDVRRGRYDEDFREDLIFVAKDKFVMLHGEIVTPIFIPQKSFVYFQYVENTNEISGEYSNFPYEFDVSELNLSLFRKFEAGVDYVLYDINGDKDLDLLIRPILWNTSGMVFYGGETGSDTREQISVDGAGYDDYVLLANRDYTIIFEDADLDGVEDLVFYDFDTSTIGGVYSFGSGFNSMVDMRFGEHDNACGYYE